MLAKNNNSFLSTFLSPYFLAFLGGCLYALGFPLSNSFSIFFAPVIGFFFLNYSLNQFESIKKQLITGFAYSFGFYAIGFYWIPHTLKEFGGLPFPINQLLGLLFSLVILPQVYLFIACKKNIKSPLLLSLIYVLLEEFIPQQFPAHLGHSFLSLAPKTPLMLAPVFGVPVYSFFTAFSALTILEHLTSKKAPRLFYSFIFLLVVLNFTAQFTYKNSNQSTLNVRIIQPNIGNFLKITSEKGEINSLKSVFDSYYELSTKPSLKPLDLIIWPETAFPTLISSDLMKKNNDLKIPGTLSQIISKTQSELFIGGYDLKTSSGLDDYENQYNSAFHFGSDQKLKDVYHKIRLIPFGEGLPFGPLNKYLSKIITNVSYFAEGKNYTLFKTQKNIPFISVICYEILFSDFVRNFLNHQTTAPQFLINLTNDSWYGDTAEIEQHLFLAKWRALEFNIPIIRSTNTGITTIIMPDGSESKRLVHEEKINLDIELAIHERSSTLYQKFGLWLTVALVGLFMVIEKIINKKIKI